MGTRCLTVFMDAEEEICNMYRQMDGYPDGHGQELADFLSGFKVCNGINMADERVVLKLANGMGCLAAQTVAFFKVQGEADYNRKLEIEKYMAGISTKVDAEPLPPRVRRQCRVGSIYLKTPGARGMWENYTYTVSLRDDVVWLKAENSDSVLFEGRPENYTLGSPTDEGEDE